MTFKLLSECQSAAYLERRAVQQGELPVQRPEETKGAHAA